MSAVVVRPGVPHGLVTAPFWIAEAKDGSHRHASGNTPALAAANWKRIHAR